MGPPRPGPSPGARRLQRLRLKLTIYYTLSAWVALVILAVIAIAVDMNVRDDALHAEMKHRVDLSYQLVSYDDQNKLDLSIFKDDPVSEGSPQVYIFERSTKGSVVRVYGPAKDSLDLGGAIEAAANSAMAQDQVVDTSAHSADGVKVDLEATSVNDNDNAVRAAIVVVADPAVYEEGLGGFIISLFIATIVLLAITAIIGYWLAGRSIRPAAAAIEQQERFLTDAAHELRTPVARMRTAAEGALANGDPVQAQAALITMAGLAEQAGEVVDNLLMLARMEAGTVVPRPERLRLDQLAGDVVAQHPGVHFNGHASVVTADPALVRRAIDNLVTNAVRHAPGAEVVVDVTGPVVTVADRGPGIDLEVLPHLFDRFVTSPTTGGSGLGLSIVQEIAAAHGGSVRGGNRTDGSGAQFVLMLPAA